MTDFKEWFENEGLATAGEIVQIYRPLAGTDTDDYVYSVTRNNAGNYVVTGGEEVLVLTEKSRKAFLSFMNALYEEGIEARDAFEQAMSHND